MNKIYLRKFFIFSLILQAIYFPCINLSDTLPTTSSNTQQTNSDTLDYTEKNWPTTCQIGVKQSPIDFPKYFTFNTTDYFSITSNNYTLINNTALGILHEYKYNIQNITDQGTITAKKFGKTYQYILKDIHFHVTSEHTFNGIAYDLEMHLVHQKNVNFSTSTTNSTNIITDPDSNYNYLVVGILFRADVNEINSNFEKFNFTSLGKITNLDVSQYSSPLKSYFYYEGGLTTPTCDESVNWVVMEKIESITPSQLKYVKNFISGLYPAGNARSTKPLNGRRIYYKNITSVNVIVKTGNSAQLFSTFNIYLLLIVLYFICN